MKEEGLISVCCADFRSSQASLGAAVRGAVAQSTYLVVRQKRAESVQLYEREQVSVISLGRLGTNPRAHHARAVQNR